MSQTWIITGARTGLGHSFAEYVLGQGHNVALAALDPEPAKSLTVATSGQ